ncbi:hypothetical protein BH23ACT11_BH23ACT11_25550 [soil metagenome]
MLLQALASSTEASRKGRDFVTCSSSLSSPKAILPLALFVVVAGLVLAGCGGSAADKSGATDESTSGATGVTEEGLTTTASPTTAATTPPASEIFFPKQLPSDGLPASARIRGKLELDEKGCLRIDGGGGTPGVLPLWPSYFELSAEGDEINILDGEGDFVARVGGNIDTGGGEIHQNPGSGEREVYEILQNSVGESTARQLRERCPGPYWSVGPSEDHIQ